jgi:nitrate/TMAO reductase-like tetraheme cytochrome c subunit
MHLGLLTALVLLLSAYEFTGKHAATASALVFIFCLPYLAVSIVSRRASFLYGTMLFGAVAYFLACYALGAPICTFPVLSVPLVVSLLVIGHYLQRRLPAELASFPTTVFRAMNITVWVFAMWALADVGGLIGEPGLLRYVAGAAFLGYAALYLTHNLRGSSFIYVYVMTFFLTLGGIFTVAAAFSFSMCWLSLIASAAVILMVGTRFHRDRHYGWSRHFYFCATTVIFISVPLSLFRWQYVVIDLALGSLLLQAAYGWLGSAIPNLRHATMAERVIGKFFFLSSLFLSVLIVPLVFFLSADLYVSYAALISGLTFSWIAWRRPGQIIGGWNVYLLGAAMFVSAGLLGLGRQLPGSYTQVWSVAGPLAVMGALGMLCLVFRKDKSQIVRRSLAEAAIFPACFAWLIPLLQNEPTMAVAGALAAVGVIVVLALSLKEKSFCCGIGPAVAGALVAGALLLASRDRGLEAWIVCTLAATAAGAWFVHADARERQVTRGATNLGWLILSVAGVVFAGQMGPSHLLFCVTAIGVASVLMAGRSLGEKKRDLLELIVVGMSVFATFAAVVVGPFAGLSSVITGLCLLVLSAAYWAAWSMRRGVGAGRLANGLFALGAVLVVFGCFSVVEMRLAGGTAVVGVLFVIAAVTRRSFSTMAHTATVAGHLTGIVLVCAALIQSWALNSTLLPVAALPLMNLYMLMPSLRRNLGFRIGTVLWLSFVVLFSLTFFIQGQYLRHMDLMVLLSLIWLALGYLLARRETSAWSIPLYISAAVVASFCCLVRVSAPAMAASWHVFLPAGMVFACLFLILRQDVFAYLLTLSLSLLAYDWVRATTSMFTQDILFYLVIVGVVIASLFILPYLRRFIGQMGTVPIFSIFTRRGVALLGVVVVASVVLLLSTYTLKATGHPKFCTSCHNMDDYYASWQHSSHADVACIQCHYEPGVTNTFKGKLEGLVQVVKYISHAYSTKPHAMISNDSCMRAGCHSDMDQSKEVLLFKDRVSFRHDKHLGKHPRGKELNCVTCHGQTVEGQHMSVGETTCITCHFYGREKKSLATDKLTECLTCHRTPEKTVTLMGQKFNHKKFLKGKDELSCKLCHSQVTQGGGAISSTRCRNCHLGKSLETKIEDQAKFHLVHVSEGHFDCLQCHDQIRHGSRPMEQPLLASGNCKACHEGERHSLQEKMYAGAVVAVAGQKTMPDKMYKAGVACFGCHTEMRKAVFGAKPFTKKHSGPKQCSNCHGHKRYAVSLAEWQEDTKDRIGEFQPELAKLEKACQSTQAPPKALAETKSLLASARARIAYIIADGSYGAHNFNYISEILDNVESDIEKCQETVSKWGQVRGEESR